MSIMQKKNEIELLLRGVAGLQSPRVGDVPVFTNKGWRFSPLEGIPGEAGKPGEAGTPGAVIPSDIVVDVTKPPFSADKSGVTDSTTRIQDAISFVANQGGGIVFFPAGTYLISQLRLKTNVVLWGAGWDAILRCKNANHVLAASGTSTGGNGARTLNDTGASFPVNGFHNFTAFIPSTGAKATIQSNTATVITISDDWTAIPGAVAYQILDGKHNIILDVPATTRNTFVMDLRLEGASGAQTALIDAFFYNNTGWSDPDFDSNHILNHVLVNDYSGSGLTRARAARELHATDCIFNKCFEYGSRNLLDATQSGASDGKFTGCTFSKCGRTGFYGGAGHDLLTNCKSFGNGTRSISGNAAGYILFIDGITLASCEAQENFQSGFRLLQEAKSCVLTACLADANDGPAVVLNAATENYIQCAVRSSPGLLFQTDNALEYVNGATRNDVVLNVITTQLSGASITSGSVLDPASLIRVNGVFHTPVRSLLHGLADPPAGTPPNADIQGMAVRWESPAGFTSGDKFVAFVNARQSVATIGSMQAFNAWADAIHPSGTVATLVGVGALVRHTGAGTTTLAAAVTGGGFVTAGTVTKLAHIRSSPGGVTGGTLAEHIGVLIEAVSGGTAVWGLKQEGSSINNFIEGVILIGPDVSDGIGTIRRPNNTGSVNIVSGVSANTTEGAYTRFFGDDHPTEPGNMRFQIGDNAGAIFRFADGIIGALFQIDHAAQLRGLDKSTLEPTYSFLSWPSSGMYSHASGGVAFTVNNSQKLRLGTNESNLQSELSIHLDSETPSGIPANNDIGRLKVLSFANTAIGGAWTTGDRFGSFNFGNQDVATTGSMQAFSSWARSSHTSGTVANALGVSGLYQGTGSGGTTTLASGVTGVGFVSGGTTTKLAHIRSAPGGVTGGTLSEHIGVLIEAVSGGTTVWGLKQEGSSITNMLEGHLRFGTTGQHSLIARSENTGALDICGGGTAASPSNGATIRLPGVSHASEAGILQLFAGNVSTGTINFYTDNAVLRGAFHKTAGFELFDFKFLSQPGGAGTGTPAGTDIMALDFRWVSPSGFTSGDRFSAFFNARQNVATTGSLQGVSSWLDAIHTSGTVATIVGVSGFARVAGSGGTVSNAAGIAGAVFQSAGTATKAANVRALGGGGSFTEHIGVLIDTVSGGTTIWGLKQEGSSINNLFEGNLQVNGSFDQRGNWRLGNLGTLGASPGAYTVTNPTTDRAFDAAAAALAEIRNVLGTVINDLKARGVFS